MIFLVEVAGLAPVVGRENDLYTSGSSTCREAAQTAEKVNGFHGV
jgi:hypothetical protein